MSRSIWIFAAGVAVGAVVAVVAWPRTAEQPPAEPPAGKPVAETPAPGTLASAVIHSNRVAAIATLRNLVSAQAQFQASGIADQSRDGVGEYGTFAELSAAVSVRGGPVLDPPVLSRRFRQVVDGCHERSGYRFRIYLPRKGGGWIAEHEQGDVDAELAETVWSCYAWPVNGKGPTFFTNQWGDIVECTEAGYSGDRPPAPDAALDPQREFAPALDTRGTDGALWRAIG